jgi:GNAT superfamily N-acetyltransferase
LGHGGRARRIDGGGPHGMTSAEAITYRRGLDLGEGDDGLLDQVIDLYAASTLGERRPIDDRAIVADMVRHANLVITAWDGELLVGIARSLTDFGYVAYLADLAVRESHQRRGIGVELVRRTRAALGPRSMIVLLAAPAAQNYYPRIGFSHHSQAWVLRAADALDP